MSRPGGRAEEKGNNKSDSSDCSEFSDDDYAWIPWFCSLKGNEFFCEVDENYAQDSFNLTGLQNQIPYYDYALDMILDVEPAAEDVLSDDQQEMVENDAETLFGLIHARYILTNRGLHTMMEKYQQCHFGRCPRVLCCGQAMLPVGISDVRNQESVKLYCPKCEDIYNSKSSRHEHIDGAYFGTTFAHLFFLTFPELKVARSVERYIPRVFGFRVNRYAFKKSIETRKKANKQQLTAAAPAATATATAAATNGTATGNGAAAAATALVPASSAAAAASTTNSAAANTTAAGTPIASTGAAAPAVAAKKK